MNRDFFDVDGGGNLRVMPVAKAEQAQSILALSRTFTQKVETFNENVSNYIEYVDQLAQKTEQEKARV
ncbi:MAG: hypothetical protein EZS28_023480 [Streblomastix strix]|uniref:Uncharacterized protein n=1 Tax=Streblomastix strix TaxID=222440 RepID=A0A5J4VF46_9EUKA|nr:MAG: hypothetical protein EZS28_023480 [Streblomastix strix]